MLFKFDISKSNIKNALKDCDGGFTLIEVLVAVVIIAFGLVSLMTLTVTSEESKQLAMRRTQAVNLASDRIERLKSIPYNNINITDTSIIVRSCTTTGSPFTCKQVDVDGNEVFVNYLGDTWDAVDDVNNYKYTFRWDVEFIDLDGDGDTGTATKIEDDDAKLITVSIKWDSKYDIAGASDDRFVILKTLRYRVGS